MKRKEFETDMPVVICSERNWIVVDINLLILVEVKNQFSFLYFKNRKKPIKLRMTLKKLRAILPDSMFAKVNNSFLVNVWFVVSFNSGEVVVRHCGKNYTISLTDHKFHLYFFDIFEER